jgi:hypothetical protein
LHSPSQGSYCTSPRAAIDCPRQRRALCHVIPTGSSARRRIMEFRSLGRTGMQVSSICLGCMMFGGRTDQETTTEILAQSLDGGINFLDTANV